MTLVVLLQMTSFLLIAFAQSQFQAILGVICTSLALGLGEVTLLSTSADYNKWVKIHSPKVNNNNNYRTENLLRSFINYKMSTQIYYGVFFGVLRIFVILRMHSVMAFNYSIIAYAL